jgi:hypothetical protein
VLTLDRSLVGDNMEDKEAQNIMDALEFAEDLSQLTLWQLFGLQQMVGHAIQEKVTELKL